MKLKVRSAAGKPSKKKDLKFTVKSPTTLMPFIMECLPGKSRNNIKFLLKEKLISVDGKVETQFNLPLKTGQILTVLAEKMVAEKPLLGVDILFEDASILVINKQAGLLTMGSEKERTKTAYAMLTRYVQKTNAKNRIFIVHRLDRETSGLLVFAKTEKVKKTLQEAWNDTIIERTYIALVEGEVRKEKDTIVSYLRESKALIVHSSQNETYGQKAITHYEVIGRKKGTTLLKVNLETGRKNQIRVHMQDIKHPIVGDKKYGAKLNTIGRLGLHAKVLAFKHPVSGEVLRFDSVIPKKFQ
jgi:23S rRNA pseudouridine1911/1915/1917 synthase